MREANFYITSLLTAPVYHSNSAVLQQEVFPYRTNRWPQTLVQTEVLRLAQRGVGVMLFCLF